MPLSRARQVANTLGYRLASPDEAEELRSGLPDAIRRDVPLARHILVLLAEHDAFGGRTDKARELCDKGIAICPIADAPDEHLRFLFTRAVCDYQDDDLVQAMSGFSITRSRAASAKRPAAVVRATLGAAMCIVLLGDPDGALTLLDSVALLMQHATLGVSLSIARARAIALIQKGEFADARDLLNQTDASDGSKRDIGLQHLAKARAYLEVGDIEPAQAHLAAVDHSILGMGWELAEYHYVNCRVLAETGHIEQALAAADEGLNVNRLSAVRTVASDTLAIKAKLLLDNGDLVGAWDAMNESRDVLRSATVQTVGAAVHAVVNPVLEEIDHVRTVELTASNQALQDVVSQLSEANRELAQEAERHRHTQERLTATHQDLIRAAHVAGMAEVATGILHDLGNALNSVGTSVNVARKNLAHLAQPAVVRVARGLVDATLDSRKAGQYLQRLASVRGESLADLEHELERTALGLEHAAKIISAQQRNAASPSGLEHVAISTLVDDAVELVLGMHHNIRAVVQVPEDEFVVTAPLRVVRILVNLLKNARDALAGQEAAEIRVVVATADKDAVTLHIIDNGLGIPAEHATTVFRHGYTTKEHGSGFGLHASATSARELGGSLVLCPQRAGEGARFALVLPRRADGKRVDVLATVA